MEYLEGIYYKEEKKILKLFRFFKNQKVRFAHINNAKSKDIPIISKWFILDLDDNGNPKDKYDTVQYVKEGKKISFNMTHTVGKMVGIDELEVTEYNGEIISDEELLLESNDSDGIIYKKYLEDGGEKEKVEQEVEDFEEEDFYDITQTSVTVSQDGKVIAEGRIHYEIFENIWNEDEEIHDREGECSAFIINGKRYDNPSFYSKEYGFEIEWGDERELDTFETFDEAKSAYENYLKSE